jgi:hypothetical protein
MSLNGTAIGFHEYDDYIHEYRILCVPQTRALKFQSLDLKLGMIHKRSGGNGRVTE